MKKMPCEDTGTRGHRVTTEAETGVCSCKPRNSKDGGPPRKPGEPRRDSAASRREQVPTPALWTSSLRTGTVSLCGLKPLGLRRSVRATLGQGQGDDGLMAEWGEGGGEGNSDSSVISEAERTQWLSRCGGQGGHDARSGAWQLLCRRLCSVQPQSQSSL